MSNRGFVLAFTGAALLLAGCAQPPIPPVSAQWQSFNLAATRIGGVTVRYEKSLEPHLDAIRAELTTMQREQADRAARLERVQGQTDEIVADINRIIGLQAKSEDLKLERDLFSGLMTQARAVAGVVTRGQTELIIVEKSSTKNYLRRGGALAGFSYDPGADEVSYRFVAQSRSTQTVLSAPHELVVPIDPATPAGQNLELARQWLKFMQAGQMTGIPIHEVTEFAIVKYRIQRSTIYGRWFNEGCANAVATELLKKYASADELAGFRASHDTTPYAAMGNQVNLQYWLFVDDAVEAPVEAEQKLTEARYRYGTCEVQRLVDRHGLQVLAAILDQAPGDDAAKPPFDPVAAISKVTGEDMAARLRRYQTFANTEQGVEHYLAAFQSSLDHNNPAQGLSAALRLIELRPFSESRDYLNAGEALFLLGHEQAADQAILKAAEWFKNHGQAESAITIHKGFVAFAFVCGNPRRAAPSAETVLAADPSFTPALAVRMLKLSDAGQRTEAAKLARRIVDLEINKDAPWRKEAERVLKSAMNGSSFGI